MALQASGRGRLERGCRLRNKFSAASLAPDTEFGFWEARSLANVVITFCATLHTHPSHSAKSSVSAKKCSNVHSATWSTGTKPSELARRRIEDCWVGLKEDCVRCSSACWPSHGSTNPEAFTSIIARKPHVMNSSSACPGSNIATKALESVGARTSRCVPIRGVSRLRLRRASFVKIGPRLRISKCVN